MIQRLVPSATIVNMDENIDLRNYWVNFNKVNHILGFVPDWTVEKGISQVIEAIRSGKIGDYRDARYSNVEFLKKEGLYLLTNTEESAWSPTLFNEESIDSPAQ
jgi:hypothetical protein